jgi:uncharacterized protein YdaU (DUF1376 family)
MIWYRRFLSDPANSIAHLTFIELGAHTRLADLYFARESALPADEREICRLTCAKTPEEIKAVRAVLREFFVRKKHSFANSGFDAEIARYHSKVAKLRVSGSKGGTSRQANAKHLLSKRLANGAENKSKKESEIQSEKNPLAPRLVDCQVFKETPNPAAKSAAATKKKSSEEEQKKNIEARDRRIAREAEARRETLVGTGPVSNRYLRELNEIAKAKAF